MSPDNREFVEKVISMFYNMDVKINAEFIGEDDDSIDKDIESLTKKIQATKKTQNFDEFIKKQFKKESDKVKEKARSIGYLINEE